MNCPVCSSALVERRHGLFEDIPVHECRACGGAFYPAGSLGRLDDHVAMNAETLEFVRASSPRALACPSCREPKGYRSGTVRELEALRPPVGSKLRLERCPSCRGFWLERGALEKVRALVLRLADEAAARSPARGARDRTR